MKTHTLPVEGAVFRPLGHNSDDVRVSDARAGLVGDRGVAKFVGRGSHSDEDDSGTSNGSGDIPGRDETPCDRSPS